MSAGVASARGRHNLFMVRVFGSSRDVWGVQAGCPGYSRSGWEAASPLAGVLESKPALPSREEDTDAAFAATACCNAIPDALACCLSKW
jgi:hypothetical protein